MNSHVKFSGHNFKLLLFVVVFCFLVLFFATADKTSADITSGLVGWWTFNSTDLDWSQSTAEARDQSGQGNHGDAVTSPNADDFASSEAWSEYQITGSVSGGNYVGTITNISDPQMYKDVTNFDESYNHLVIYYKSYTNGPSSIALYYTENTDCSIYSETCRQNFSIIADGNWHWLDGSITDAEWVDNDGTIDDVRLDFDNASLVGTVYLGYVIFDNNSYPPVTSGHLGQALSFDGVNDYVRAGTSSSLSFSDNFTLSAWVYPTAYHTVGFYGILNGFIARGPASTYNYALETKNSTTITFIKRTGTEGLQFYDFTGVPSMTNKWTLVTMRISGGIASLYINGSFLSSKAVGTIAPVAGDVLYLGAATSDQQETRFTGRLDDVRVYNRTLSPSDITDLYNAGVVNQAPIANATISKDGVTYADSITVTQGVATNVWLAADSSAGTSNDPNGWTDATNGVSSGGKCEWNRDINQGVPTFELPEITNPASATTCNISLGSKTFNDSPGTYTYSVLRITDKPGLQSNVDTVQVTVQAAAGGPVGWWKFDDGSGNQASDSSGNGNAGTLYTPDWTTDPVRGMTLSFNGSGDYVQMNDPASGALDFPAGQDFSLALWFKSSPGGNQYQNLLSKGDGSTGSDGWTLRDCWDATTNGSICFRNNNKLLSAGSGWFNGNWHQVVVSVSRSGNSIIYVDGYPRGTLASSNWNNSFSNTFKFEVGRRSAGGDEPFKGLIDDVRVYKRVLSQEEITALYDAGGGSGPCTATEAVSVIQQGNCYGDPYCFNSLAAWQTAKGNIDFTGCASGDLTCSTVNKIAVAKIVGSWSSADTQGVNINGWITDACHYVKIYTTPEARHNGKWDDTSKYRLDTVNNYAVATLKIDAYHVWIDGLQVKSTYGGAGGRPHVIFISDLNPQSDIRISNNIIQLEGGGSVLYNTWFAAAIQRIWNNIIYTPDKHASSSATHLKGTETDFYNNTVYNFTGGINLVGGGVNGLKVVKNNISVGNGSYDYQIQGSYISANNISQDATSPDAAYRNKTVSFVSTALGNEDLHLSASDPNAKDNGVDLSSEFTTDIDGQTRPPAGGGTWDIGADESGASAPFTVINLTDNITADFFCYHSPIEIILSWDLSDPGATQASYEIQVNKDSQTFDKTYTNASQSITGDKINRDAEEDGLGERFIWYNLDGQSNQNYSWRIKVWNESGIASPWSEWANFTIVPPLPDSTITPSSLNPSAGTIVTLRNNPGVPNASWLWSIDPPFSYENSTGPTSQNPEVIFYQRGFYSVTMTVTDTDKNRSCTGNTTLNVNYILPNWKEIAP